MATIINGYIGTSMEDAPGNLWADLQEAFEFKSVSGSDANKIFAVTEKVSLKFKNFDMSEAQTDPTITVTIRDVEIGIYSLRFNYFNKVAYQLIISDKGDVIVRISGDIYSPDAIRNNAHFTCAIVKAKNTVDKNTDDSYGVYIPYSNGGVSSGSDVVPFNNTPKYLITNDVTEDITNTGVSGSTAVAMLQYIENDKSAVTALVPIFAVCSQCVSVNSFVMAIGNGYRTGETVLNGKKYYMVGGFAMLEGDVDD